MNSLAGPASLMVWDSMFLGRIASAGYEYEQFYAFFPLYPLLVRLASSFGAPRSTSDDVHARAHSASEQHPVVQVTPSFHAFPKVQALRSAPS